MQRMQVMIITAAIVVALAFAAIAVAGPALRWGVGE